MPDAGLRLGISRMQAHREIHLWERKAAEGRYDHPLVPLGCRDEEVGRLAEVVVETIGADLASGAFVVVLMIVIHFVDRTSYQSQSCRPIAPRCTNLAFPSRT